VTAIPAEFFLFVLFFDFRRRHGLRERQRQRVAVIGRGRPRFCMSASLWITAHCVGKYTLSRLHPYPSPVSAD
jgi:hypothetical protein